MAYSWSCRWRTGWLVISGCWLFFVDDDGPTRNSWNKININKGCVFFFDNLFFYKGNVLYQVSNGIARMPPVKLLKFVKNPPTRNMMFFNNLDGNRMQKLSSHEKMFFFFCWNLWWTNIAMENPPNFDGTYPWKSAGFSFYGELLVEIHRPGQSWSSLCHCQRSRSRILRYDEKKDWRFNYTSEN